MKQRCTGQAAPQAHTVLAGGAGPTVVRMAGDGRGASGCCAVSVFTGFGDSVLQASRRRRAGDRGKPPCGTQDTAPAGAEVRV